MPHKAQIISLQCQLALAREMKDGELCQKLRDEIQDLKEEEQEYDQDAQCAAR